ncbi:hypothetical protein E2562_013680 [Oryza meyeriana var. granulata]|uniref:Uncharacterized protein n=1 Tax=Oryza meyeriana var. granulata TaxID=110450 RepID=A0A6G1BIR4_9ORYZ|nr:hypothetical protein E2562_013680 [Oryza meyeriana var. granulata]
MDKTCRWRTSGAEDWATQGPASGQDLVAASVVVQGRHAAADQRRKYMPLCRRQRSHAEGPARSEDSN